MLLYIAMPQLTDWWTCGC